MKILSNVNSKYLKLFKNTFVFALGNIGSKLIVFLLVPLYTNFLTSEEYGAADFVFTISQLFIPVVSLVIFDAVMRYGLQNREHPESTLQNGLIVWLAGSLIMLAIMPFVAMIDAVREWKWYLYLYVTSNIFLSVVLNYLKVKEKNLCYSLICVVQTAVVAVLNIILIVYLHDGVRGYLLSNVAGAVAASLLAVIMGHVLADLRKAVFDSKLFKQMLLFSAPLVFNNLAWWVIQSSDKVMIQHMVGLSALGLYTVATRIPSLINVVVSVFQQAWGISSSIEMDTTNDTGFYGKVFEGYAAAVFLACLGLNSIVKPFMRIYVGAGFLDAWIMVPLLMVAAVYSAIAAFYGGMYGALEKSVNNMATTLLAGIINIGVNYICILHIGAIGAVVGTVVSYIVMALVRMIDVHRYIAISISWAKFSANSLLVLLHALLVMTDFHVYSVSFAALLVFLLINRDFFKMIRQR